MDGFAFAGESLCGNLIGGGDSGGCVNASKHCSDGCGNGLALHPGLCCGRRKHHEPLSDDAGVRLSAKEYYSWVIAIPAVGFASFTWDRNFHRRYTHKRNAALNGHRHRNLLRDAPTSCFL